MILLLLVRKSKIVLDSGFDAVDSGFQVPDSGFFDSGTAILDSNPYSLSYTGRNPKQKFPSFRIPQAKISRIPESGFPCMWRLLGRSMG